MSSRVGNLALTIVFLLAGACAPSGHQEVRPNVTRGKQLTEMLGAPVVQGASPLGPEAELRTYVDCEYQLEKDLVSAKYCKPDDGQRTLQYWKQLWRGDATTYKELPGQSKVHGPSKYILDSPGRGMSVIYDARIDRVVTVIDYSSASSKETR